MKCKYGCEYETDNKGELMNHYKTCPSKLDDVKEDLAAETDPKSKVNVDNSHKEEAIDVIQLSIEKQLSQLGKKTAELLKARPQEKVLVPIDKLNKYDEFVVVGINGWNLQIQKGVPVMLPDCVVDLLIDGGYQPTRVR